MAGFDGYGAVPIDFGGIGGIVDTYTNARKGATRERVLSDLGKGTLDYGKASQALLAAGDTEGGLSLARLAEARSDRAESRGFRQQSLDLQRSEAARHATESDRDYKLKEEQAKAKPTIVWQEDENGQKVPFLQDPRNPEAIKRLQPGGSPAPEAANPYAATGKLTEQQSKDRLFANRMIGAHGIINKLEGINEGAGGFAGGVLQNSKVPGVGQDSVLFNTTATPDRQRFVQSQRDFVNAVLRKESGAAISQSEFDNARKQYFPMPGDSPEVIAQKRTNRMTEIEGLMAGAGKGYKPPEGYVGTKDKQAGSAVLDDARAAIKAGAPRDKVLQRLKQNNINPGDL